MPWGYHNRAKGGTILCAGYVAVVRKIRWLIVLKKECVKAVYKHEI